MKVIDLLESQAEEQIVDKSRPLLTLKTFRNSNIA